MSLWLFATAVFLFVLIPLSRQAFIETHLRSELESLAISVGLGVEHALGMEDLDMIADLNRIIADNPDVGRAYIFLKAENGDELIASFPPDEEVVETEPHPESQEKSTVRRDFSIGGNSGYVLLTPGFERLKQQSREQQTLSTYGLIVFLILQASSLWFLHKKVHVPSRQISKLTNKIIQHCGLATAESSSSPQGDLKRTAELLMSAEDLLSCSKISSK